MRSGAAGIGGAAFVLSAVLVAGPLYVSSVGSAALQLQFEERCPSRIGLVLPPTQAVRANSVTRAAQRSLEGAGGLAEPVRTTVSAAPIGIEQLPEGVESEGVLFHRPEAFGDVEVVDGPVGDGVWLPDTWAEDAGLAPGDTLHLTSPSEFDPDPTDEVIPEEVPLDLPVAATYRSLVGIVPPAAWCLQPELLRPNRNGDPPPPLVLLDDGSLAGLPSDVVAELSGFDVIPLRRDGLTVPRARDLVDRFGPAADDALQSSLGGALGPTFAAGDEAVTQLPSVLARADGIQDLVRANARPVQVAGALAALTLSVAAGLLTARRREAELRTRAVRGEGPARLAGRVGVDALGPVAVGVAAGAIATHLVVRAGAPSSDLARVWPTMLRWSLVAALLAVTGVTASAAVVARGLVDAAPARARHRVVRAVPWELVVLLLVWWAADRLDDVGGAQFVGNETTGVDGWAMAFPMLAVTAGAVVLVRPARFVASRLRRVGAAADPAAMLGLRRLAFDPTSAAVVAGAVALASATAIVGGALSDSGSEAVLDKAATFVGADAAATLVGRDRTMPASLAGRATETIEDRGFSGERRVVVLGIDPATFADGAIVTDEERALVERLAAAGDQVGDDVVPAIVVGPLPETSIDVGHDEDLRVEPIARPDTFPTSRRTSTLVVVDAEAVDDLRDGAAVIVLGHGSADDLEQALLDEGRRVGGVVTLEETATGTSRAAIDWAYGALRALGAVVVTVLLGVQLARGVARVRQRQLAEVFTRAMGLRRHQAVLAEVIEQGLPVAVGLAAGTVVALLTAGFAVPELDSARILPPRSRLVVPTWSVVVVAVVAVATLVVVVAGARRQANRVPPSVVLRG